MAAIAVFAAVAGLVWGTVFVLRARLVVGCLVFLLLANCFGTEFLTFNAGPINLSLDRLFLVLVTGAYAVQRRLKLADPKPLRKTDLLLGTFLLLLAASAFTHNWHDTTNKQVPVLQHLINGYLMAAAVYWVARQSPLDERQVRLIHASFALFGVYLAVTGLAEITRQWWLVFPKYIADPKVGLHFGRARGPMVQSVSYGLCLAVCLLNAWIWQLKMGRLGRLLVLSLMPLYLAAIFATYTRSIWLGTGLGLLIVLGLTLRGPARLLVLGSMASAGLLVGIAKLDAILSLERGDNNAGQTRESADMRTVFAYVSWQMFLDRPLLGCGFGQFPREKLPYLADRSTNLRLELIRGYVHHNTYLSLLTETGLLGLSLFLSVLGGWCWSAWQLCRSPGVPDWARRFGVLLLGAMGVYSIQLLGHELSFTPLDNSLMFFLSGVTAGLAALVPASAPRRAPAMVAARPLAAMT